MRTIRKCLTAAVLVAFLGSVGCKPRPEVETTPGDTPRSRTNDEIEDLTHYVGYTIAEKHAGSETRREIARKHGTKIAARFDLSSKSSIGSILYVQRRPIDARGATADGIENSSREVGLAPDICGDVIAALRNCDIPHKELDDRIARINERIEALLEGNLKK